MVCSGVMHDGALRYRELMVAGSIDRAILHLGVGDRKFLLSHPAKIISEPGYTCAGRVLGRC